jgi:hypothetical protein
MDSGMLSTALVQANHELGHYLHTVIKTARDK